MTQTHAAPPHVKTDHQIQTAVVKELDWSPGVESAHVGVAVTDGAVTLSGEVLSLPERNAAVAAAMRIHSVVALVDEIVVKRPDGGYHDADIARDATTILGHHVQLKDAAVTATVRDHVVTLAGTVDWHFQREAACAAVQSLTGVVEVVDAITVVVTAVRSDAEDAIRAALVRAARTEADRIDVTVDRHTATLRGQVYSWKERQDAERAAYSARGVTRVHNELIIVP